MISQMVKRLNAKFALNDYFFGNVKITKNTDPNKYSYSGYGIEFDSSSVFSIQNFDWGKNIIIFGVDRSASVHASNKNKDVLVLDKGQTRGLDNILLTAEAEYSIIFSRLERTFCLSLHYNGRNCFLFVDGTKIHQFKAKNSEINAYFLCVGNISKDFSVDNMKKTRLSGYFYEFSVDYDASAITGILDIHKYLRKKHNIK